MHFLGQVNLRAAPEELDCEDSPRKMPVAVAAPATPETKLAPSAPFAHPATFVNDCGPLPKSAGSADSLENNSGDSPSESSLLTDDSACPGLGQVVRGAAKKKKSVTWNVQLQEDLAGAQAAAERERRRAERAARDGPPSPSAPVAEAVFDPVAGECRRMRGSPTAGSIAEIEPLEDEPPPSPGMGSGSPHSRRSGSGGAGPGAAGRQPRSPSRSNKPSQGSGQNRPPRAPPAHGPIEEEGCAAVPK